MTLKTWLEVRLSRSLTMVPLESFDTVEFYSNSDPILYFSEKVRYWRYWSKITIFSYRCNWRSRQGLPVETLL